MHLIYNFVAGPLLWLTVIVFFGGSIYRILSILKMAHQKDIAVYAYFNPFYALRSVFHWIIPFANESMKKHPLLTIVSFAFHICLFLAPLFLFAHIILIKQSCNISWGYIPDIVADIMTVMVILSCIFFLIRRIRIPEIHYLSTRSDYIVLAIVAAPFITGFLAYHQWVAYDIISILHILSGEIMLMCIPFTKLNHALFFFLTRGYMGSEFGKVRHSRDW
ncbi:MAG: nitrate reductase [Desulfobacterales bacterium]|nr:nitrate reductase [Desulfobacterales bacterium]